MSSSSPLLLSRRALLQLKSKYPQHFTPPKSSFKPKENEAPWPMWMQIAGYSAVAIAIPYTLGVVITQSRRLIDSLEGEASGGGVGGNGNTGIGRTIVRSLRWYWGQEDHIPYVEYLEKRSNKQKVDEEISLENEDDTYRRLNQERIERDAQNDINVVIESEGVVKHDILKGNSPLIQQLTSSEGKYDPSKGVIVSFQDDSETQDDSTTDDFNQSNDIFIYSEPNTSVKEIMNMSTIYAMWHYFPPVEEMNVTSMMNKTSSKWMSPLDIRIDELKYKMTELQKSMNNPLSTRDRDDMEKEMKEMRKELGSLRREKRKANLKKLFPF